MKLQERLDKLRKKIQEQDYLEGKGLSNEVNISIFCYDAKDEMLIRYFVKQIQNGTLSCNIIHYDLYEVFLSICEDKRILKRVSRIEERRGKKYLQDQIEESIDSKTFANKMNYDNHQIGDVVVLSGVGKVFPFMRVHGLLEAMQPLFNDVPVLVFYPGEYNGHYVKLFNRLTPNEYYRAFKSI